MDGIIALFPVELPDEDAAHLLQSPGELGRRGGMFWQDSSGGLGAFLGHMVELCVPEPGFVSRPVTRKLRSNFL